MSLMHRRVGGADAAAVRNGLRCGRSACAARHCTQRRPWRSGGWGAELAILARTQPDEPAILCWARCSIDTGTWAISAAELAPRTVASATIIEAKPNICIDHSAHWPAYQGVYRQRRNKSKIY